MSVLRVVLAAVPSPSRAAPWALFDAAGRCVESGNAAPAAWPAAERREAVLAATAVRIASVPLPPMPADRIASAVAYALEDQLAGPAGEHHLAAATRRRDGIVEVAVAQRALVAALARDFARLIAEPSLAPVPPAGTWRWHASALADGFVRKPDGGAFAVSAPVAGAPLPPELALALRTAPKVGGGAPRVEVAFACTDAQLDAWSREAGSPFTRGAAWRWDLDAAASDSATDLLQGEFARGPRTVPARPVVAFRWAAAIAAAALALHVGATLVHWSWLRYDAWQTQRAIIATARDAGAGDHDDAQAAAAALARRAADARHAAGRTAPADALPLLARAAPVLGALPAGAVKSATYTTGTWTIELAKLDADAQAALDRGLAQAGLASLQATTAAGTRVRVTPAPGTERP